MLLALFSALATLTKGPLGLILPLATAIVFLLVNREGRLLGKFLFNIWWVLWIVLVVPWYLYAGLKYGNVFLWEFFVNCHWNRLIHPEHHRFNTLYFYPGVIAVGMIPWTGYLPMIGNGFRSLRTENLFALTWLVVMFAVFTAAQSKLSTYIAPVFPALAMLTGLSLAADNSSKIRPAVTAVLSLCLGIAVGVAPLFFKPDYPDFVLPGLVSFGTIAVAAIVAAVFVWRHRIRAAIKTSVLGMIAFAIVAPLVVFPKLETALTESDLPSILATHNYSNRAILCSGLYVRGVRFYSGNPVVIMAGSKNPFWSAHPLTVLSEDQKLRDFVAARDTLLCVFTERDLDRLNNLTLADRDNIVLSRNIDRFVVLSAKR
jgi:4-amino-4-deoxy-L-arabinose transferase-like glycosyltransferase